ncbi:unnamed protein product [Peronospora destructor]|uniref:Uncharacterized protein n=1 Tax=Peronospora destructor TaxID=86335 RepID=A0AAV0UCM3_9STRA|nr:unnamed protein product [Peronospora destructor]
MATFMPGDEVVEQRVTFSRAMFAQLRHQIFFPPKLFLSRDARYRVLEKSKGGENTLSTTQAADIGLKLVCGLELVYAGDYKDQLGRPWKQKIEEALQLTSAKLLTQPTEPDDSDSWLYMHPDTLESSRSVLLRQGMLPQLVALMNCKTWPTCLANSWMESPALKFGKKATMEILPWLKQWLKMEAELAGTKVAKAFHLLRKRKTIRRRLSLRFVDGGDQFGSVSFLSAKPLDLDYNLLSNLLESFASQEGHAGPVSTILNEMSFP